MNKVQSFTYMMKGVALSFPSISCYFMLCEIVPVFETKMFSLGLYDVVVTIKLNHVGGFDN